MPAVYIKTYGCQMNERDSEQVARMLQAKGYDLATDERQADVVLVNTCSVRDQAEQKALGKMGLLSHLKRERPGLILGFMGCMAQSRGQELVDRLPDLDLVLGTQQFHRAADCIDLLRSQFDGPRRPIVDVSDSPGSESTIRDHVLRPGQATAFVSIMQGCDMSCAYCIVPATRGRERSRPIPEIVREVEGLVASGVREVTLLGQIVNLYGRREFPCSEGRTPFVQLLHALDKIPGLQRIRFTSPHPAGLKDDLIRAYAELPKLCEHMHLPVQSGSDRILRAMRRSYTREIFLRKVDALRAARPDIALTTDIIVAFPGETERDFLDTCSLAEEVRFDNAFIFRYSDRRDTPAASMDGQLPEDVKQARNQHLLQIVNRIARDTLASLVGSTQEILVEGPSKTNPSRLAGRTRHNRIAVFEGHGHAPGSLLALRITRSSDHTLYGCPAET
ncbi:MAG: tRNA (N6-isopentenyl adenosine(37)-C2)-methylthiotransferase MiaB [Verrucomicrobiae bacterium]|nr:tRNA (N6-isopentenyl adenosine(37)-C2)-methylthiotransferase MiaB [Verrucomicrobiae bacterium]